MLVLSRKVNNLSDFGFGNFVGVHPADADPFAMDMEHDLRRFLMVFGEEAFENVNDEFHGGIIVVQQQNLVH